MKIQELQQALKDEGFDPGPVDGDLGPRTREAIRAFQKANGLTVDGIVGSATLGALRAGSVIIVPPLPAPGEPRARRLIHTLVWHCTATPEGKEFTRAQIDAMHRARGFSKIGYHKLIHLDGRVSIGRAESEVGAHVAGHNVGTLGFSYVGGVDARNRPKDTRTPEQKATMVRLTEEAARKYKLRAVVGHRDLSPDRDHDGVVEPWEWVKSCPCFDVVPEYGRLLKEAR